MFAMFWMSSPKPALSSATARLRSPRLPACPTLPFSSTESVSFFVGVAALLSNCGRRSLLLPVSGLPPLLLRFWCARKMRPRGDFERADCGWLPLPSPCCSSCCRFTVSLARVMPRLGPCLCTMPAARAKASRCTWPVPSPEDSCLRVRMSVPSSLFFRMLASFCAGLGWLLGLPDLERRRLRLFEEASPEALPGSSEALRDGIGPMELLVDGAPPPLSESEAEVSAKPAESEARGRLLAKKAVRRPRRLLLAISVFFASSLARTSL
mmetsp:Transcript_32292/g.91561  ORF Transcript_32292/g.91561 Transcript_32292/m.91561 type:complete len:267 (-) Transcript_32292:599-1399(-)